MKKFNFKYDSSIPISKKSFPGLAQDDLKEFPPFISNAIIRFPGGFRKLVKRTPGNDLIVLYFHPWEFVNMKKHVSLKDLLFRPDRWIKTGNKFLELFEKMINYFQDENYSFVRLDQVL